MKKEKDYDYHIYLFKNRYSQTGLTNGLSKIVKYKNEINYKGTIIHFTKDYNKIKETMEFEDMYFDENEYYSSILFFNIEKNIISIEIFNTLLNYYEGDKQ